MAGGLLGIGASPRKGGNSDAALSLALEAAAGPGAGKTVLFLRDYNFSGCVACGGCRGTGRCVVQDDMQKLFTLVDAAEIIIISTPVFFMNIPGKFKSFIDRFQSYWERKYTLREPPAERRRKGALICAGGMGRPEQLDLIRPTIKAWFHVIDADYTGGVFLGPVDAKGEVERRPEHVEKVGNLIKKLLKQDLTAR